MGRQTIRGATLALVLSIHGLGQAGATSEPTSVAERMISRVSFERQFDGALRSFGSSFPYKTDCNQFSPGCKYQGMPKSLEVWIRQKDGFMTGVFVSFDGAKGADPDDVVATGERLCAVAISVLSESKPRQSYPVLTKAMREAKSLGKWDGEINGIRASIWRDELRPAGFCNLGDKFP